MQLLGDVGHVGSRFDLFGYSANLDARLLHDLHRSTVGWKIIFDAPDGTPR
jgi:hypothetical protein